MPCFLSVKVDQNLAFLNFCRKQSLFTAFLTSVVMCDDQMGGGKRRKGRDRQEQ